MDRPILDMPVRFVFVKFVPLTSLFAKLAFVRFAPERSHPRKLIPDRSTDAERSADRAIAVGPRRYPPRTAQMPPPAPAPAPAAIVGNVVAVAAPPVIPPPVETTPVRFALVKFAPEISTPAMVAPVRLAPVRFAPVRLTPVNITPAKFAERRRTLGPTMNPPAPIYTADAYDGGEVGKTANARPRKSPVVIFVSIVVAVNTAPLISAPVKVVPDKSTPSRLAPTSDTPLPTRYPPRTTVDALGIVAPAPAVAFNNPPLRTPVIVAEERFAPEISQFAILRLVRSVPARFALMSLTPGPTIHPMVPPPPRAT